MRASHNNGYMNRRIGGTLAGVLAAIGFGAAMLPIRAHLSIATSALILVIPVVAGVAIGGFVAGLVSVAAGFIIYDFAFIPPYWTLTVGNAQHWVALGVYAFVMIVVARVVASLDEARAASHARATNAQRLFELSEMLIGDHSATELSTMIVGALRRDFALEGVALLQPVDDNLKVVASSGTPLSDADLHQLQPDARTPVALSTLTSSDRVQTLALVAADRPVGLLVLQGLDDKQEARELLPTLANHLALALERAQLQEQAVRVELLEEIDRLRRALLGAVSHDLRSPLATIKVASSALLDAQSSLSVPEARELYELIDLQTDRLSRLVTNLLDMTRIQTGVLEVHREPWSIADLAADVVSHMQSTLEGRAIDYDIPSDIPLVDIDHLLIEQVIANLIDNAHRHGPVSTPILISARENETNFVEVAVQDQGPGVPDAEKSEVFETFVRFDTGGRAGLGLAIAKAFVEAHGGSIWIEDPPHGGARIVFTIAHLGNNGSGI